MSMFKAIRDEVVKSGVTGKKADVAAWCIIRLTEGKIQPGQSMANIAKVLHDSGSIVGIVGNQVYQLKEVWSRIQAVPAFSGKLANLFEQTQSESASVELSPETSALLEKAFGFRQAEQPAHQSPVEQAVSNANANKGSKAVKSA